MRYQSLNTYHLVWIRYKVLFIASAYERGHT
ncbi:hypothetical protein QFZ33_002242 [Arthrobacter globiformis]|nr:hypothetical protein [Arthrobacter globiformis]